MRYKLLGKSGLRVSELCLGTMTFGEDWEIGTTREESRKVFDLYAAAGGNFLDTANMYANGTSEKIVGEFIKGQRDKWVIATKYTLNTMQPNVNTCGNHRKNMFQSVEASLKRMNIDYIDLLWLHVWDYTTPIEEVMRGFDDLVRAGKVMYVGFSDTPAWIMSQANTIAQFRGWAPLIALQVEYSLKERTPERELIPMAKNFELGITPWSPLAGGLLSGKYHQPKKNGSGRLADKYVPNEREDRIVKAVLEVAKEAGRSPSQIALNWIRQQHYSMIPIIGARKADQIKDNLACVEFKLTAAQMRKLDEASHIPLGFPYDFFKEPLVQDFVFGGTLKQIDLPGEQNHVQGDLLLAGEVRKSSTYTS